MVSVQLTLIRFSLARLGLARLGSAPSLLIDDLKTDRSVVIQLILRSLVLNGQIVDISWVLFQFGILPNAKVLMLLKFPEHQNYEKKQPPITVGLRCGCEKKEVHIVLIVPNNALCNKVLFTNHCRW